MSKGFVRCVWEGASAKHKITVKSTCHIAHMDCLEYCRGSAIEWHFPEHFLGKRVRAREDHAPESAM